MKNKTVHILGTLYTIYFDIPEEEKTKVNALIASIKKKIGANEE